ncbi:Non-catalytic module expn protein [Marasmius tenuissimus]|nr:Non-catalytic module expn protein [Marasmius tenuissimus]
MFSKSLLILLAALSLANIALASPHLVNRRHHHALAARGQSAPRNDSGVVSKRALRKRCRTREPPTSTIVASSSAAANIAAPPTTEATTEATPTSTSSSQQQEPTRTSEQQQQPPPTTEQQQPPPTTTSEQSAPTQDSGNNGGNNDNNNNNGNNGNNGGGGGIISGLASYAIGTLTGQGTFYNTGLTACGTTHSDSEAIVAVSQSFFDQWPGSNGNPNLNPICNKRIRANFEGKSVELTIVDRCVGCAMFDIDMTPSAFSQIADQGRGRISGVTWTFI